jgi:hypothetical protein
VNLTFGSARGQGIAIVKSIPSVAVIVTVMTCTYRPAPRLAAALFLRYANPQTDRSGALDDLRRQRCLH